MNRTEVLEKLAPIMDVQTREIEHKPKTRIIVTPDDVILHPGSGGHTLNIDQNGFRSLMEYTGIPGGVSSYVSKDTLGRIATELLGHKEKYAVILKEDKVTAFARVGQHHYVRAERVLAAVEHGIGNSFDYHKVLVSPGTYIASLEVTGEKQQAVAKGDLIQAGALVQFSPIGTIQPLVQSYALRLMCTNGATSRDVLEEFKFGHGEGDDIWQWFRQSVRAAYRSVEKIVTRWQAMISELIPDADRAAVLNALIKEARVPKEIAAAIQAKALQEPPRTAYDMMNLMTWASSHLIEAPRDIRRAQIAAATFADVTEHRRICPVCNRSR